MHFSARVNSKGQVRIPGSVREALSIKEGDDVLFRIAGRRPTFERTQDLIRLAGSVNVPAPKRGTPWDEVLRQTRHARTSDRR